MLKGKKVIADTSRTIGAVLWAPRFLHDLSVKAFHSSQGCPNDSREDVIGRTQAHEVGKFDRGGDAVRFSEWDTEGILGGFHN
jgi:hypothetical protein